MPRNLKPTLDDLFHQAKKLLENSPYTIVKESQNHGLDGGGKVIKFYRATKQQDKADLTENGVFYGNPQQARNYLMGIIHTFSEFLTVPRLSEIPAPADETYFNTQSDAINYARERALTKYYRCAYRLNKDHEEVDDIYHYQPLTAGQTARYHYELGTKSELLPEMLHIIIYKMESGKYELTHYIN